MESPIYTRKYIAAIEKAKNNPDTSVRVTEIIAQVQNEQNSLPRGFCGVSQESTIYHKLLNEGLCEKIED